ncbi:hypothetical protein IMZ48_24770 [Candidatus Bathyarchaeota archaeon]|nr:hypothetical protein [Candidatus Bathyarchaeota archaeon]
MYTDLFHVLQSAFYKTFGRPIIKSLLVAMLTYQMIYLLWMKLEADETKIIRNGSCDRPPNDPPTQRERTC